MYLISGAVERSVMRNMGGAGVEKKRKIIIQYSHGHTNTCQSNFFFKFPTQMACTKYGCLLPVAPSESREK